MITSRPDGLSAEDLEKILALVENSDFDSIELNLGDLKFVASRYGSPPDAETGVAKPETPQPTTKTAQVKPAPISKRGELKGAGLITVMAPIVGIFYGAPEPGATAYVTVGDRIEAGTTIGLIEVMKVFNAVPADVSGTVVQRLVEDSELVEYGQPLFVIQAEDT